MGLPLLPPLREIDALGQVGLSGLQFIHVRSRGDGRVTSELRMNAVMPESTGPLMQSSHRAGVSAAVYNHGVTLAALLWRF